MFNVKINKDAKIVPKMKPKDSLQDMLPRLPRSEILHAISMANF